MKNLTIYIVTLFLSIGIVNAQSNVEIPFKTFGRSRSLDKNLVTVRAIVNSKQAASMNGMQFSIIVSNISGKTMSIKNIADILTVSLYNEQGLDISVENESMVIIDRKERKWKFRSESVIPDQAYINGKKEKRDLKEMEYIEIPAGGKYMVNLKLKNVKEVKTPKDVNNRFTKPTLKLASGKYQLKLWLSIRLKPDESNGILRSVNFESPMIPINYGK